MHNRYRSENPSGEDRVVDTETRALSCAGHAVANFGRRSDDIATWPLVRRASLPLKVVASKSVRDELEDVLRRERPDVVHVHNTFPLLTPSVLNACAKQKVPVVATFHNYRLECANGAFFRDGAVCHDCTGHSGLAAISHRCYRGSALATAPVVAGKLLYRSAWRDIPSAYIFISESQRRALTRTGLPLERSFVKWNLVPRLEPRSRFVKRPRVAYLGRLDEAKGLPVLMRAWDMLQGQAAPESLELSIAGSGPLEEEVRRWASTRRNVEMLGLLDRQGCADLLAGASAAILASSWEETFGLVVVEAFASGVPVIAPAHGSLPELVEDGVDGDLFRPGDPADLARLLARGAADPYHWETLGLAARRAYEKRFDPDTNLAQLEAIYHFAIANNRAEKVRG